METRQNYDNAWRLSIGITHNLTEQWTLRGGFAWDQSPVASKYRFLRIPDNERWWLAFGFSYKTRAKGWRHDFGLALLYNDTGGIDDPRDQEVEEGAFGQFNGRVKSGSVIIPGYQLNYQF